MVVVIYMCFREHYDKEVEKLLETSDDEGLGLLQCRLDAGNRH